MARDGEGEEVIEEVGSRPTTGVFLAATVDMIDQVVISTAIDFVCDDVSQLGWREGGKDKQGVGRCARYLELGIITGD